MPLKQHAMHDWIDDEDLDRDMGGYTMRQVNRGRAETLRAAANIFEQDGDLQRARKARTEALRLDPPAGSC